MPEAVIQPNEAVVALDVGVCYPLSVERIRSFKEWTLRRLSGRLPARALWAVRGVDLRIDRGEVFGIVGRNGAGKSTLLKVIARVLRPSEGRVLVRGEVSPLLELGAGFHSDLTGRENVYLAGALLGRPRREMREHLDAIVEFAGIRTFLDMPVRNYSTGMLARLGFATATEFRPDLLIVDEVLSVGDTAFQEKCLERLAAFRDQGTTILLVSHDLPVIESICDRAAWLEGGTLRADGSPGAVLEEYLDHLHAHPDPEG